MGPATSKDTDLTYLLLPLVNVLVQSIYACVYIDIMCIRAERYLKPAIISANKCLVIL